MRLKLTNFPDDWPKSKAARIKKVAALIQELKLPGMVVDEWGGIWVDFNEATGAGDASMFRMFYLDDVELERDPLWWPLARTLENGTYGPEGCEIDGCRITATPVEWLVLYVEAVHPDFRIRAQVRIDSPASSATTWRTSTRSASTTSSAGPSRRGGQETRWRLPTTARRSHGRCREPGK